jgi:hypothetical protein
MDRCIRCTTFATALLLCAGVSARDWNVEFRGGGAVPEAHADTIDPATMRRWREEAEASAVRLGLGASATRKIGAASLRHPLARVAGIASNTRIGISNFVDRDPAFPDRLRDYQCGTRTYDTQSGYNHAGIDYFLWPFPWQSMAQETVAAVAAAPGTIVSRADGNPDRNCSFDATTPPNMVWIAHDDGGLGVYLHFKRGGLTSKQVGERVAAGEFLGWIGSSGISTGPHLHFELHAGGGSAGQQIVDPNQGQCHTEPSRWQHQPAYREPRLELVGVHRAPPEFRFESCSDNETPHFEQHFRRGESLVVVGYYADQRVGQVSTIVVRAPDGTEVVRRTHAPTADVFGGCDAASASYFQFGAGIPADARAGIYSAEISYQGATRTRRFAVGGPIYGASGIWYDPAQSGQGFTTEVVEFDGKAWLAVVWFAHLDGAPRWMSGLGEIVDDQATVAMQISDGGRFPPAFEPAQVDFDDWGELRFRFDDDDSGRVEWSSDYPGFGDGAMPLSRLAGIVDIDRDDEHSGIRACASGSWYDPAQSGHGVQLQVSDVGGQRLLLATWYVYHEGQQFWLSGAGPIDGKRAVVALDRARGGDFPPGFDPADVTLERWGTATFELVDPTRMQMRWDSVQPGFGTGSLELSRLTELLTAPCL